MQTAILLFFSGVIVVLQILLDRKVKKEREEYLRLAEEKKRELHVGVWIRTATYQLQVMRETGVSNTMSTENEKRLFNYSTN